MVKKADAQKELDSNNKALTKEVTIRWLCAMRALISIRHDNINSRKAFAISVGLSPQNLSATENDDRNVTVESIVKICQLYSISPTWLLLGQGDMFGNNNTAEQLSLMQMQIQELKMRVSKIEEVD